MLRNHFEFPDGEAILKNALQIPPASQASRRARVTRISPKFM